MLGAAWIILMLNILPNKDNYLAYVGRNTMPVYIFHLIIRQILKKTRYHHGAVSNAGRASIVLSADICAGLALRARLFRQACGEDL